MEHGHGLALVFARTETAWFHRYALAVDAWCFIRGRLHFIREDGEPSAENSGAPSMLLAAGEDCVEALAATDLGITIGVNDVAQLAQATIWGQG